MNANKYMQENVWLKRLNRYIYASMKQKYTYIKDMSYKTWINETWLWVFSIEPNYNFLSWL